MEKIKFVTKAPVSPSLASSSKENATDNDPNEHKFTLSRVKRALLFSNESNPFYISQLLSSSLDDLTAMLISGLARLQIKKKAQAPLKARRRILSGLHETLQHISKVRLIICAADLADVFLLQSDWLDLIEACYERKIMVVYSRKRRELAWLVSGQPLPTQGRLIQSKSAVAIVGILFPDGMHEIFHKVIETAESLQKQWHDESLKSDTFWLACAYGHLHLFESFEPASFQEHLKIIEPHSGMTVLHVAAMRGHFIIVEKLLAIMDSSIKDFTLRTPLHYAAMYGHLRIVSLLIRSCSKLSTDASGLDPLSLAIRGKFFKCVEMLLPFITETIYPVALSEAAAHEDIKYVKTLLKYKGWSLADKNPILVASLHASLPALNILIQEYPELLEQPDKDGRTAVWWAAYLGHENIYDWLCSKGANINVTSTIGPSCQAYSAAQLIKR